LYDSERIKDVAAMSILNDVLDRAMPRFNGLWNLLLGTAEYSELREEDIPEDDALDLLDSRRDAENGAFKASLL